LVGIKNIKITLNKKIFYLKILFPYENDCERFIVDWGDCENI